MISKAYGNARSYPNFKYVYYPGICLEGLEQISRKLSQYSRVSRPRFERRISRMRRRRSFHVLSTKPLNMFRWKFVLIKHGGRTPLFLNEFKCRILSVSITTMAGVQVELPQNSHKKNHKGNSIFINAVLIQAYEIYLKQVSIG